MDLRNISLFVFIPFCLMTGRLSAQEGILVGQILDGQTGEPMAYVNVGIPETNFGTVTDVGGRYALQVNDTDKVVLQYSFIGYATQRKSQVPSDVTDTIRMWPVAVDLPELVVRPKGESKRLGSVRKRYHSVVNLAIEYRPDQNLGSAVGRRFRMRGPFVLDTFSFYLAANDFQQVTFRIQVMDVRRGRVGAPVHTQPVLVTLQTEQKGWVHVDLRALQLMVQKECIVYVEWVAAKGEGKQLSIPVHYPLAGQSHYYRYGSQNRWKRFRAMGTPMQLLVHTVGQ